MNLKLTLAALVLGTTSTLCAADRVAPAPQTAAAESGVTQKLDALIAAIRGKLQNGAQTESDLADELKQFDALLAENRGNTSEEVARVAVMRGVLYAEVLKDADKAMAAFEGVKKDFPGTESAAAMEPMIKRLEAQRESMKAQAALQPGRVFPDFAEKDLNGEPLSISKFKGKVVLVDFWATWCPPCVQELPNVREAYEKYHDKGFEIIGISLDRDEKKLRSFIAAEKMPWPQYFDGLYWNSKLGRKYGINSIPATYLLDGDGKIIARDLRGDDLEKELARLLGAKS